MSSTVSRSFLFYMFMRKVLLADGFHACYETIVNVIRCWLKEFRRPIVTVNIVPECIACARGYLLDKN